jgi:hypothetical protein
MSTPATLTGLPARNAALPRPSRRRLFLPAVLIGTAIAIGGFWRTYFGPLLTGSLAAAPIIHIHAVSMVAWLALVAAQVWLAASGRRRLHVRLGSWVMGYSVVMVLLWLLAISHAFADRLAGGDVFRAQRFLFGLLREVVFMAPFLAAGWLSRRRPEVHKRVMLVAATLIVAPAIGRMAFLGRPPGWWAYVLIWPAPLYLMMVHDYRSKRLIHPAYVIGLAAMLAMRLVLPLGSSAAWQSMASHITALYPPPGTTPGPH